MERTLVQLMIMLALSFAVVWNEEDWTSWIDVLCVKSSLACIWSNIFNGSEIFDKVRLFMIFFLSLNSSDQLDHASFLIMIVYLFSFWQDFYFWLFFLVQHSQGILLTTRRYITNLRSDWKIAPRGAWSSCNTTGRSIWTATIWWGEIPLLVVGSETS